MNQTLALLLDAYRELNAKKLFWITMILSALIIVVIGAIGIDKEGISIFGWSPEIFQSPASGQMTDDELNKQRSVFYKEIFNLVGIQIWLTWGAIFLAIFSTASLFPDLMTTGAIDTLLTKPIGRLRLFLTKYLLGLGFVAGQVTVFAVSAFLIIGIRASDWDPKMFLAIPIVVLFFSYLYAICVLAGVLTRSTLLAVILTIVAWLGMFVINMADSTILGMQVSAEVQADIAEARADYIATLPPAQDVKLPDQDDEEVNTPKVIEDPATPSDLIDPKPQDPADPPADIPAAQPGEDALDDPHDVAQTTEALELPWDFDDEFSIKTREGYERRYGSEDELRDQADFYRQEAKGAEKWRGYAFWAKTPLPKTGETSDLMTRLLRDEETYEDVKFDPAADDDAMYDPFFGTQMQLTAKKEYEIQQEQRPWSWIILTSILFEFVVVGLAAWRFCGRDY